MIEPEKAPDLRFDALRTLSDPDIEEILAAHPPLDPAVAGEISEALGR